MRRVHGLSAGTGNTPAQVDYEVLASHDAGQRGHSSSEAFRAWARFEVQAADARRWTRL